MKVCSRLADRLPHVTNRKAFIFSTAGAPEIIWSEAFVKKNHSALREKLQSRGYVVVDEFSCPGFNTNSFLTLFGGINKGRPNAEDLRHAEEFARNLLRERTRFIVPRDRKKWQIGNPRPHRLDQPRVIPL